MGAGHCCFLFPRNVEVSLQIIWETPPSHRREIVLVTMEALSSEIWFG